MTTCLWCKREFDGVGVYCSAECAGTAARWPTCAVCSKWVDEMAQHNNPIDHSITFVATCHGDRDAVTIPMAQFVEANGMVFTTAFAKKALSLSAASPTSAP